MELDGFTHHSLITKPYNLTYSYYLSPSFNEKTKDTSLPVLLLLHGFPDNAHMWAGVAPVLLKRGYPLVIPDLLGFSGSSKPTNPHLYNYKQQADSLAQILDSLPNLSNNPRIIPIGHDWGSATAQRFYLYHRTRCIGLSIISLAYQVPSPDHFSLWTANRKTAERFGYPQWAYWEFFTAPDAPDLMRQNLERFWDVNNGNYPSPLPEEKGRDIWMREQFCVTNAMREYVTKTGKYKDFDVEPKKYPNWEAEKKRFVDRMSRDGFEGPVCYYHSLANNTMIDDERKLCEKGADGKDQRKIEVPMLYMGQTGDWVCRTDLMVDAKEQGLVPDLEEKVLDAGHWWAYEKPEEGGELIAEWLDKRFPIKS
jgi:soluble epoxide hydrolase / lipid-phosphate phosphatase